MKCSVFQFIGKRNYQQDAYYYDENEGVGIVCDGIGSNVNSHIFAQNFTKAFAQFLQNKNEKISDRDYEVFISKFKSDFITQFTNIDVDANLGCTLAFVKLMQNSILTGHLGDSKVLYCNKEGIIFETKDHNLYNAIKEEWHSQEVENLAVRYKNQITKAVSLSDKIDMIDQHFIPNSLQPGEYFLIFSDGVIFDGEKENMVTRLCGDDLFNYIKSYSDSSSDNATCLYIR